MNKKEKERKNKSDRLWKQSQKRIKEFEKICKKVLRENKDCIKEVAVVTLLKDGSCAGFHVKQKKK